VETWSFNSSAPLNAERLQDWLSMLYSLRPFAMLRLKGILQLIDQEQPVLLQAVGSPLAHRNRLMLGPADLRKQTSFLYSVIFPAPILK
jgi:G3E family GTPase